MKKKFKIKSNFQKPITLTDKELKVIKGGNHTTGTSIPGSRDCSNCTHCPSPSDVGTHIC